MQQHRGRGHRWKKVYIMKASSRIFAVFLVNWYSRAYGYHEQRPIPSLWSQVEALRLIWSSLQLLGWAVVSVDGPRCHFWLEFLYE